MYKWYYQKNQYSFPMPFCLPIYIYNVVLEYIPIKILYRMCKRKEEKICMKEKRNRNDMYKLVPIQNVCKNIVLKWSRAHIQHFSFFFVFLLLLYLLFQSGFTWMYDILIYTYINKMYSLVGFDIGSSRDGMRMR